MAIEISKQISVPTWDASARRRAAEYWHRRGFEDARAADGDSLIGSRGSWFGNLTSFDMTKLRARLEVVPMTPQSVTVTLHVETFGQVITEWNRAVLRLEVCEFAHVVNGAGDLQAVWTRFRGDDRKASWNWGFSLGVRGSMLSDDWGGVIDRLESRYHIGREPDVEPAAEAHPSGEMLHEMSRRKEARARSERRGVYLVLGVIVSLIVLLRLRPDLGDRDLPGEVVMLGCATIMWAIGMWELLKQWRTRTWVETRCVVKSRETERRGKTYFPVVYYEYRVRGRRFLGEKVHIGGGGAGPELTARETIARYRPGTEVVCYYDSSSPNRAVLDRSVYLRGPMVLLAMGVGFALFALWIP